MRYVVCDMLDIVVLEKSVCVYAVAIDNNVCSVRMFHLFSVFILYPKCNTNILVVCMRACVLFMNNIYEYY